MAGSQSGFDMEAYKHEADTDMATVMPDYWLGHGRILIHEQGFEGEARAFADKLLERMGEKYPDKDAEMLARSVIEQVDKHF